MNDWHAMKNNGLDVDSMPLMGTRFRNAGYSTGYFGKWHIASAKDLEHRGFEEFAINQGNGNVSSGIPSTTPFGQGSEHVDTVR